jgi:sulfur carrier protein
MTPCLLGRLAYRLGSLPGQTVPVKVLLRNPRRELDVDGPMRVLTLLDRLELNRESVLVVRGDTLVPGDALLDDTDTVEIRPVISGGTG